jgi:outer membrane receptor protein involved in Fe transport
MTICGVAYGLGVDPITGAQYQADPVVIDAFGQPNVGYPGFDPHQAGINNGEGFDKDLSGNQLPNAPPFTVSFGAQYTMPLSSDWAATLRSDYYWQDYSWARIFNDRPYDRLRGYTNVNLTLILTSQSGWQVMLYDKNVFNTTAITGDFLNSDDTGLTTNVFLTDPRLFGIRVTKNW